MEQSPSTEANNLVAQVVKISPAFCGTRGFITVFTSAATGPYPESDEFILMFRAEDGGSIFLRNVGNNLQIHTVLEPRRSHTYIYI
jgi:hypothetical protein